MQVTFFENGNVKAIVIDDDGHVGSFVQKDNDFEIVSLAESGHIVDPVHFPLWNEWIECAKDHLYDKLFSTRFQP